MFRGKYPTTRNNTMESVGNIVEAEINNAPDYYAGEIESLRAKVDKQTEILVRLANLLSDEDAETLADKLGYVK